MSTSSLVLVAGILFLAACSEPGLGPAGLQSIDGPLPPAPRVPCTTSDTPSRPPSGEPALKLAAAQEECRPTL